MRREPLSEYWYHCFVFECLSSSPLLRRGFRTNYPDDPNLAKPYNVLSLDGGGSRGVMEAVILKDMMACLTLVQRGELEADMIDFIREESRTRMREKLDGVVDLIHPGDVFKMVSGTSTGAIMAFGLLHGEI